MAEMDNFSGINENFDTIKTLLNSIRAQGILNTSDVDKLLSGINSKLEKINTEEDIDLIKIFLSELKQNLEERHSILISKFGAIESLFTNLLKNSSEMPKSADIKELFDIVATNLSVFSREVVSQKESLTDIILRLDAIRSDDTNKKDIIKNITLLKPDIDRLNNGFDSIVISLNDNFKTIIKAISGMDKSEYFNRFSDSLKNSEMSMNTILSALQVLDKKTLQIDDSLSKLATNDSLLSTEKQLSELTYQNKELVSNISNLSDKCLKIDTLADKIDASVNIIATLKAVLDEADDNRAKVVLEQLKNIEAEIHSIDSDEKFQNLKIALENILKNISETTFALEKNLSVSLEEIQKVALIIKSLDINVNFQNLIVALNRNELAVKTHIDEVTQQITTLQDANVNRILNDLSTNTDSLTTNLNQAQVSLSALCEKNFSSVSESIMDLKAVISQLDENSISANNAIFSNITDRLTVFENSLRISLDNQEKTVSSSTTQLFEYVENIKNISSVLDYKMDSSVVEVGNIKREFNSLKSSIDDVLALDFVNTVKDLRVDLYASKQELINSFESGNVELSEKISNDLYGKYELLISKLDAVEEEIKKTQVDSLGSLKNVLENISNSIIDILSYVSEEKDNSNAFLEEKISEISNSIKENSLDYIEAVRDVVNIIKIQVENNLEEISAETNLHIDSIKKTVLDSSDNIKKDISNSYNKLLEIQDSYKEIKNIINTNSANSTDKFDMILNSTEDVKIDFENKITVLKSIMLDKISEFKQQFTCENADKVSELKFAVENLYNKNNSDINIILDELREKLSYFESEDSNTRAATLAKILENFVSLKDLIKTLLNNTENKTTEQSNSIVESLNEAKELISNLNKMAENNSNERKDSIIESLNEAKELISNLNRMTENNSNERKDSIIESLNEAKELISNLNRMAENNSNERKDSIVESLNEAKELISNLNRMAENNSNERKDSIVESLNEAKELISNLNRMAENNSNERKDSIVESLNEAKELISNLNSETTRKNTEQINNILESLSSTKYLINSLNDKSAELLTAKIDLILEEFVNVKNHITTIDENIDNDLTHQLSIIESNFEALVSQITILFDKSGEVLADKINNEFKNISNLMDTVVTDKLEGYKLKIEETFDNLQNNAVEQSNFLKEKIIELNSTLNTLWKECSQDNNLYLEQVAGQLKCILEDNSLKTNENIEILKEKLISYNENLKVTNSDLISELKIHLDDIAKYINSSIEIQTKELITKNDDISTQITNISTNFIEQIDKISSEQKENISNISEKITLENINNFKNLENLIIENQDSDKKARENLIIETKDIKSNIAEVTTEICSTRTELISLNNLIKNNQCLLDNFEKDLAEKTSSLQALITEISAGELQSLNTYIESIAELIEDEKKQILAGKELLTELIKEQIGSVSKNIEKETDLIIGELIEQFDLLKQSQADDIVNLTSRIEEIVNAHLYNNIEDLKSYLDIKTDNSIITSKIDNFKLEIENSIENVINNLNKLLDSGDFSAAMSDYRIANEILINSSVDNLNKKIEQFFNENIKELIQNQDSNNKSLEDKLTLFDKKFIDTVVDKYEELKLISNKHNDCFNIVQNSLDNIISEFTGIKNNIDEKVTNIINTILETHKNSSEEIRLLNESFENLKAQISNRSFDEAFQTSINKQINDLESLITEQLNYIEDINELCSNNLPDVTELNTLVKHSVLTAIDDFNTKLDNLSINSSISDDLLNVSTEINEVEIKIEKGLKELKTDVITQVLNIFNQISFVAEEEEILDFIQEKHDELISILSHIVTTFDDVNTVKDNLYVVDTKIDDLKDEINLINEKITAIISSEGNIDYVYSLHDLESDIANLRLALNDMKENMHGQEFADLIKSTNDIYGLVEALKLELPSKNDFNAVAEDILSISTRTNKLILASEESYKTLQDNLQDFKLVVDDLDERTKNFARETGIEKIDSKLNSINSMMKNGEKTTQIFNQVFEYLAEWVDNASTQINSISDKVETLDDIGQIKMMLADLKAGSEDNTESLELIEALGTIFDKQAKKINSLETKLDKIIVETTINNKNNAVDMSGMENILNKFLVKIDEKMTSQQNKINSLELKLENVINNLEDKDTTLLTKKVGGMDRQIAKLNKSIEKIASHVVEK